GVREGQEKGGLPLFAVALLVLGAAAAGALFVAADLARVALDHQALLLAVFAGAGRWVVGVPGGSWHGLVLWLDCTAFIVLTHGWPSERSSWGGTSMWC